MGGMLEDMEKRIDEERDRAQQKKLEEAQDQAKKEAEKAKDQAKGDNNILI